MSTEYFVHETAVIDSGAMIGAGTKIWHWTHISAAAKIGKACSLGQNVYVANQVEIGNHVKIQNNVSVYDNVIIEDYVFCGPSMVFTNVINPRAEFPRKNEYKPTLVMRGATLGANCTVICGITIGQSAFIAAGSVVTKSVKDFALVMGVPARQTGWIDEFGIKLGFPLRGKATSQCNRTGKVYVLENNKVRLEP